MADNNFSDWRPWFAWRPVYAYVGNGKGHRWVWWRWLSRCYAYHSEDWLYRVPSQ